MKDDMRDKEIEKVMKEAKAKVEDQNEVIKQVARYFFNELPNAISVMISIEEKKRKSKHLGNSIQGVKVMRKEAFNDERKKKHKKREG